MGDPRFARCGDHPDATACTFRVVEAEDDGSPFLYQDTASARAGIGALSEKLKVGSIAIIGAGGTGSYLVDLLAKTHVAEIHLFDGDHFGCTTRSGRRAPPRSPTSMAGVSRVHGRRSVTGQASDHRMARGARSPLLRHRYRCRRRCWCPVRPGAPDRGLPGRPASGRSWIPMEAPDSDAAVYSTNIQVGELNALAAVLAVMRWKRYLGIYLDQQDEQLTLFTISGNDIVDDRC